MSQRVVIVGAGVIGLCAAHACARSGHRVVVIERRPRERDGCSFGNAGLIVPSHFVPLAAPGMVALGLRMMWNPESPFWIRPRPSLGLLSWAYKFWRSATREHVARAAPLLRDLNLASRAEYERLAAETGNSFGLERRGVVMVCKSEHVLAEEAHTADRARELGLEAEVLDPRGLAALEPELRLDAVGGVHFPQDCHLVPHRLVPELERLVAALGVELRFGVDAISWRRAGRDGAIEALVTDAGELVADDYVLCGGAWTPSLVRSLGTRLPMQAGKGYSLTMERPPRLPRVPALLVEARVAVTPMAGAVRFGGTMEIAGGDETVRPARVRGIVRAVPRYLPDFREEHFAGIAPWYGFRPCSPDGLPYLGRLERSPRVIVAAGHAMMGLSLGPVTGSLVADLVSGEAPAIDIALLRPERHG